MSVSEGDVERNPYAPPLSAGGGGEPEQKVALRELVLGWERLRLFYNLFLLVPGVLIETFWVMKGGMPLAVAVISAVMVGLGANAAFFLGPLAELYWRGVFRKGEPIGKGRMMIFGAGLVVSAGVFLVVVIGAIAAEKAG